MITRSMPLRDRPSTEAVPQYRWYALTILTIVYALNIADRYSISTLLEPIRVELGLSDGGVAFLTGVALALFYVTIGVPLAALADRGNRRNILAAAVLVWSAMTTLCGLAQNYWHLLLARFGVGIGEAGGTPPSTSMLADYFPPGRRPMALTIFSLGACLGAWLGSAVAGAIAQSSGWRAAFLALGIPGLVVAAIVRLSVREPRRGQFDSDAKEHGSSSLMTTMRFLVKQRSAWHLIMGGSVATLWSWGLMWWTPAFLQRSHHLTVGEAGQLLGSMHLVAGAAGTLLTALFMARPTAGDPRHVARLVALATALSTVPSVLLYWTSSIRVTTILLWMFVPALYIFIGPVLGLLQNVVPAGMRATACAIFLFIANIANLVVAPQLIGCLSDWFAADFSAGTQSLRWALLLLAPTGFWAAWHLWASSVTIRADEARVAQGLPHQ